MSNDEAHAIAAANGMRCAPPCVRYAPEQRIFSLQGLKHATVKGTQGGGIWVDTDYGEQQVLAYYEIGVPQ